jgi:hypothetical protein
MRPQSDRWPSRHLAGEGRRSWIPRPRRIANRPGLEPLEPRVVLSSTIYTVNSIGNGTAGSGTSGTLPYVISLANADTNPDGSEVTFDPTVFSSPQTIDLDATLVLNESPGPEVIDGPGAGLLVVAGDGQFGIFSNYGTATLSGLIITGGGVGGPSTPFGDVGGVFNQGTITLLDCTISGNTAYKGGGITNYDQATLTGCTISNNVAEDGGALYNRENAVATLNQCTISGNFAYGDGGGVDNDTATATLNQCTISGNSAAGDGGGLANGNSATTTLSQCTISANSTGNTGGGLSNAANATASLIDTIVAGNTVSGGEASDIAQAFGAGVTGTSNLIGPGGSGGIVGGTGGNIVLTRLEGLDLAPLSNYGGPTQTMALLPGSSAIGAGTTIAGVTTDQRGLSVDSPFDIGAFQLGTLYVASIAPIAPETRNTPVSSEMFTLDKPPGPAGIGDAALTLSDDLGPNLIDGDVSITLVSGSTYQIDGLSGLTAAEGNYTLIVDPADDTVDPQGGLGSSAISWLMDTTPPSSSVDSLPAQTNSTSFAVRVTASDTPKSGDAPSGVASIAIYDSVNGGPFVRFATVLPSDPVAIFTGQPGDTYAFYSVATDNAGNIEPTPTAAEATITVSDSSVPGGGGSNSGTGTSTPMPVVVVGEQPVFLRKLNKRGKPVGQAVLSGFTLEFGTPLDATAAIDPADYQVATVSTKKVRKTVQHILHPIPDFTVSYGASDDAVTIHLARPEKFPTGGQLTILGGVSSASGGALGGTTAFEISKGGKSIVPG